jgi:transcriptional regulator with XRE-family HTH domain
MSQLPDSGLGRKLAILAKLKGMTQEQIARECAMSRISVNRFFRQHTEIRAGDLSLLLQTLGINLEQLIDKAIEHQMNGSNTIVESAAVYRGGACPEMIMSLPMGLAV